MGKPKVLILGKIPPPYMGPSVITETILRSSLNTNLDLFHLDTTLNKELEGIGKMNPKKPFRLINQYRRMKRILRKESPDLVVIPVSQTVKGFLKDERFLRLAQKAGTKTLIHLHGGALDKMLQRAPGYLKRKFEERIRKCDGAIVLGNELRRIFTPYLPEDRIHVIPNGINPEWGAHTVPQKEPYQLLYFANLIHTKGLEDVLEATAELQRQRMNLHLDVVGEWFDGKLRERCNELLRERKVPVTFHAPATGKEKKAFFDKADLFIFPPRAPEGHPVVLIEAMAAGLPIISTPMGAIPESVIDGENGNLVEPRSPMKIASLVMELKNHPEEWKRKGQRSRELYEKHFTEDRMVDRLEKCFLDIIQKKKNDG